MFFRKPCITWGTVNTWAETVENFTNFCTYMLSCNRIINGNEEDSNAFLLTIASVGTVLSGVKFYLVRKQNLHFEELAEEAERNAALNEAFHSPLLTDELKKKSDEAREADVEYEEVDAAPEARISINGNDDLEDLPELEPANAHESEHGHEHDHCHGHSHGHSHGCEQEHSHEHAHAHAHGEEHGHSHGSHPHIVLTWPQRILVETNFITNHITNYSSSMMSLLGVCINDLMQVELAAEWKWTIVGASTAVGLIGAFARRRNDEKIVKGDFSTTLACGHASHGPESADGVSQANAAVEVFASISGNFNYAISAYDLTRGGLQGISLYYIIPSAVVSTIFAGAAWYTHSDYNQYFEPQTAVSASTQQGDVSAETEEKKTCSTTKIKALTDFFNHAMDYSTTPTTILAYAANKLNKNLTGPTRYAALGVSTFFGLLGAKAPYNNELKTMITALRRRVGSVNHS